MTAPLLQGFLRRSAAKRLNRFDLAFEMSVLWHGNFQGIGEVAAANRNHAGREFIELGWIKQRGTI